MTDTVLAVIPSRDMLNYITKNNLFMLWRKEIKHKCMLASNCFFKLKLSIISTLLLIYANTLHFSLIFKVPILRQIFEFFSIHRLWRTVT